jgi:hypothetical protein
MAQNQENPMDQVEMQQCIQDCLDCNTVCLETAMDHQEAGGPQANPDYVLLLQDCAEICMTAAHFMQHDSPLYGFVCQTCALVCNHTAGICDQAGDTDCANACRTCAWSCDQLAKLIA